MATYGGASADAQRWAVRHTRRLARDVARLEQGVKAFGALADDGKGPWTDEARRLAKAALGVAQLAAYLDGLNESIDLMTEDDR